MIYGMSGIVWDREMLDTALKVGNILAWLLGCLVYYFSNTGALSERIAIAETKLQQEMTGYSIMQSATGQRLERIEKKMDCLLDKRMCH